MNPEIYKKVYKSQSEDSADVVQKAIETGNRLKSIGKVNSELETKHGTSNR
jgi:hypothetical protein